MQAVPVEADRFPSCRTRQQNRDNAMQFRLQRRGKKRDNMPITGQDTAASTGCKRDSMREISETKSRHNSSSKQLDCIAVTDEPCTTSTSIESLRHYIMRTRSEQAIHRPPGHGIDV